MESQIAELVGSYTGLSMVVAGLVGGIKRLWRAWIDGKEPVVGLALTLAIGICAKFAGLYGGTTDAGFKGWFLHLLILVFTAIGAGLFHDKVVNPVLAGKPEPK